MSKRGMSRVVREFTIVVALLASTAAGAKEPVAPPCKHIPAAGDPACEAVGHKKAMPKPVHRAKPGADESSGLKIGHNVSIDAKTNFNENRFGQAPLEKFNPRPRGKDVSAGPQLDIKF